MTLWEACDEFIRWDHLAMRFKDNQAIQGARKRAYEQWLVAVRYWRLKHG